MGEAKYGNRCASNPKAKNKSSDSGDREPCSLGHAG
jgi:hypothetical protein